MPTAHNLNVEIRSSADQPFEKLILLHARIEQCVNGIAVATLSLSVHGNPLKDLSDEPEIELCQPGKSLSLTIDKKPLFIGVITDSQLTLSQDIQELTLTLKHELVRLDHVIRSRIFADDTDENIVRTLCQPSSLSIEGDANNCLNVRHEQRIQYHCSDWQILRHTLYACGVWLISEPSGVKIIRPSLAKTPDHTLSADSNKGTKSILVESAQWHFSGVDQPASLTMASWNIKTQEPIAIKAQRQKLGSGALDPAAIKTLSDTPWTLGYGVSPSDKALKLQADSLLGALQLKGVQGIFTIEGGAKYQLGQRFSVTGYGKHFDGSGILTAVEHTITPSRWITKVTLGDSGLAFARMPLPDARGMLPGVVADYSRDDPRNFSRIRVHLNTLEKDTSKNQVWARFAMPYASDGQSFLCYPEPGDEVVVGFFDGSPDYPVIVGAMHNPLRKPAVEPGKSNSLKGWDFGDLRLQVDTRKEEVIASASKGALISVDGKKVTVKGPNIDLKK